MQVAELHDLRTQGFRSLPGLVPDDELGRLRRAVDELHELAGALTESSGDFVLEAPGVGGWAAWRRGIAPIPGLLRSVQRIHEHVPYFSELQERLDLVDSVVTPAVGAPVRMVNSFLWAKPPKVGSEKPWHQDMAFAPPEFDTDHRSVMTVWIAVDAATESNGCLQFVPGSHLHGLLPHTGDQGREPDDPPAGEAVEPQVDPGRVFPGVAPVSLPLSSGSAVVFDGLILHRSAPNLTQDQPRTAVSFVFEVPRPVWTRAAVPTP